MTNTVPWGKQGAGDRVAQLAELVPPLVEMPRPHEASFKVPSTSWRSPPGCRRLFAITAEALSFKESPMESSVFHAGDKYENRCLW